MEHLDRHNEHAFCRLDDVELEAVWVQMSARNDSRLDVVIRELVLRAVRVIELVCRTRGTDRGLSRDQILKSIDDASVRPLLRLKRPNRQPPVTAVAAEIAAACVSAQRPASLAAHRLASRRPDLRVAEQLGDALSDGRLRRNNWRNS